MKITISGPIGSGKSTVSKILAAKLGYKHYSIGGFMRDIAKKRSLSILELSKRAESDPTIDDELDQRQSQIGKSEDNFVMDSRLGYHFILDSFSIFLDVSINEAVRRITSDKKRDEKYKNTVEAVVALKERMHSESLRYNEYYGIKFPDKAKFRLVIDTTKMSPEETAEKIIDSLN